MSQEKSSRLATYAYDMKRVYWEHLAYILDHDRQTDYVNNHYTDTIDLDVLRRTGHFTVRKTVPIVDLLAYVQQCLRISWFWGYDVWDEVKDSITWKDA